MTKWHIISGGSVIRCQMRKQITGSHTRDVNTVIFERVGNSSPNYRRALFLMSLFTVVFVCLPLHLVGVGGYENSKFSRFGTSACIACLCELPALCPPETTEAPGGVHYPPGKRLWSFSTSFLNARYVAAESKDL